jgi:large subunit ribosomal protein L24
MNRIKTGDDVIILVGKDKGRRGEIARIMGDRVIVDGINMIKKHVKGNPQAGDPGGIQEQEASIHISNVALWNPKAKKADRVGVRVDSSGKKERFFKSDSTSV